MNGVEIYIKKECYHLRNERKTLEWWGEIKGWNEKYKNKTKIKNKPKELKA